MNQLSVLLDVTPLGCAPTAKTGLARVAESLGKALVARPSLAISTCAFGSVVASAEYAAHSREYAALRPAAYRPSLLEQAYLQGMQGSPRVGQCINLIRNPLRGIDAGAFDVIHSTYARLPRVVRRLDVARVITIHDIIGLRLPVDVVISGQAAISRRILRSIGPRDWVACVSEHTRQDFLEETGHPESRTVTIHNGVDHERFRPTDAPDAVEVVLSRYGVAGRPYVLTLSSLAPHKNLAFLASVWREARKRHPDARFVVAGGKAAAERQLRQAVGATMDDTSIVVTGFVLDDDFAILASRCHAFLFPSLYEGFGLPPLEAMACGAPVIASNSSSLPEVIGTAGTLLDPRDRNAWGDAVASSLAAAPTAAARAAAIAHARTFTWTAAADAYERLYRIAAAETQAA